jgi:lipoate-protein ligase A
MLTGRQSGDTPPTLRLYRWERPTLSLGRFQNAATVDLGLAAERGIDVVRRPTGGRAVLHDDELTYSVVAGVADGVPTGTVASYRHFAAALADAFLALGVTAEVTPSKRGAASSAACYLATSQADLAVGASKLSGSAQVWERDTVLQHGSFVVSRDVALEAGLTRLDAAGETALGATTCTIEEVTGRRPDPGELVQAVCAGFAFALGIALEPDDWAPDEVAAAHDLEQRFRV